eukprot:152169-Pyramimonas_sp.AAC.1
MPPPTKRMRMRDEGEKKMSEDRYAPPPRPRAGAAARKKGKPTPQESATQRFEKVMERAREHHSAEKEWTQRPKSRIHDATVNALAKSAREMARFTGDDDCSAKSEQAGMVIKEISARRIFFEEIRGKTVDVAKRTITSAEHQ